MVGYPAVFYYPVPVPVPAQLFPETGYLNRIIIVWPINLTKVLVCSGLKPFLA